MDAEAANRSSRQNLKSNEREREALSKIGDDCGKKCARSNRHPRVDYRPYENDTNRFLTYLTYIRARN